MNGDVTLVVFIKLEQIRYNYGDMHWVADFPKVTQQVKLGLFYSTFTASKEGVCKIFLSFKEHSVQLLSAVSLNLDK